MEGCWLGPEEPRDRLAFLGAVWQTASYFRVVKIYYAAVDSGHVMWKWSCDVVIVGPVFGAHTQMELYCPLQTCTWATRAIGPAWQWPGQSVITLRSHTSWINAHTICFDGFSLFTDKFTPTLWQLQHFPVKHYLQLHAFNSHVSIVSTLNLIIVMIAISFTEFVQCDLNESMQ